jgi:hypothetical protein
MTAIMLKLKALYQSVRQEFCKTPVQSLAALGAIIFVLLPIVTSLLAKGSSSNRIISTMLLHREMNLPLTMLSLILLVWSYIHLLKQRTNNKSSYEFFEFGRVLWKIHNPYDETTIQIEETPYCNKHKAKLIDDGDAYLSCPLCRSQSSDTKESHDCAYIRVKSIIMALTLPH